MHPMILRKYSFLLVLFSNFVFGQITQIVRGKITDKEIGTGLPGVIVQLKNSTIAAVSDINGNYKLLNVPTGRHSFLFTYTGYESVPVNDVIVTSGKEMILNIEMEERATEMAEVEVKASIDTNVVNTMQPANMKTFSIEETERYAGSRSDPARMAANFAGIQGTDDSRNDIVVRGNSPAGLLWRLEEIDIPNPNHFAVPGSAGGPQTIINDKYLANSQFYTGAFPANYGNALGGVFDLKMRNGNNEKHERTFQFGLLGTELALEGPISKESGATYLITYRYSSLALFSKVHFNIGTSAVPGYQDMGLRLNFPTKKAGVFSFSSIGGLSDVKIILSKTYERPKELYGDLNRDQYFGTNMGVGILTHTYSLSDRTIMKTSLAYGVQTVNTDHYLILRNKDFIPNDTLPHILHYNFYEGKTTLAWYIKSKLNSKNSIKTGIFLNRIDVNFHDSVKVNSLFDTIAQVINNKPFKTRINTKTNFYLIQPYVSYVHKFNEKLSFDGGVFAQLLTLNNKYTIEPRAGLKYQFKSNQSLSFAYGLHSQMQQTYLYFAVPDTIVSNNNLVPNTNKELTNKNLDFTKSQHFVLGYDYFATKNLKFKTEVYYQYLWNVPVYVVPSSVSMLNSGATFSRFLPLYSMVNKGTGYNYGIEFTVEKLFHKHYFFMYSASLYDSKYAGSDGVTHNTDFNGNYMMNLLGGLEYNVGKSKKNILSFGGKFTYGGGKRYSPVDIAASNAIMDVVAQNDKVNSLQFPPYNRLDFKISYKVNFKRTGLEFALDLLNVLNTKNILALSYSPDPANLQADPLVKNYQLGFIPIFYIKVDF
ncbi:MAG: carboxypeptidase-like regulatory domain-containing protein [Bacteroidia bacterium]